MVTKITTPHRVHCALNYNEKKVQNGQAECLGAFNYLRPSKDMNFYQKLDGLERRNILNDRATTKTLHVSLNFDPLEKLSNERLFQIATLYMEKIGFGAQPYLVYKHNDAGHPHIHIVSTTIREDGSRINTHNLGRQQSEKARKELEIVFGLVRAGDQKKLALPYLKPVDVSKVVYGKVETKKSIAYVVNRVFNTYAYASLPEFNAALRQFHVVADRGKEGGRIYHHRGLIYRILDDQGVKIGVPIKASLLPDKPTMENLEKRFRSNETKRQNIQQAIIEKIESAFLLSPRSLQELQRTLEKKQVFTLLRQSSSGGIYGITFVDNELKAVFNGSDLGRHYTAASLQRRLLTDSSTVPDVITKGNKLFATPSIQISNPTMEKGVINIKGPKKTLLDPLLHAKPSFEFIPQALLKKKKKKKNKQAD